MNPIFLLGAAVISFFLEGCNESEEKPEEKSEESILGKRLVNSIEQTKKAMEGSDKSHRVQFSHDCNRVTFSDPDCETQNHIFQSFIFRNFAKRFDINCYSKPLLSEPDKDRLIKDRQNLFNSSNYTFDINGNINLGASIFTCEVGNQLPETSPAQPASSQDLPLAQPASSSALNQK